MTPTTEEMLRQEFEAWLSGASVYDCGNGCWAAYQACNTKRQEEMARDKALLRECFEELTVHGMIGSRRPKHMLVKELEKHLRGYGNE